MPSIRAFRHDDIDEVARLHQESFPPDTGPAPLDTYRTYFRDTFFRGPYANTGFPSLVCEEPNGSLTGFLGVVPVRMMLADGRSIWATLCTQFCVDPQRRGMTGLRLLRAHLGGKQDLSISDEANTTTMRLWVWAGGEAVTSSSLHFVRPLRPARLVLARIELRTGFRFLTRRFTLSARLLDHVLARVPRTHVRPLAPATTGEPLDLDTMTTELPALLMPANGRERRLVPHYEPSALAWTLVRAQLADGKIVGVRVRAPAGKLLGWYVYLREPDDTALLLQLAAPADAAPAVLDHLLHDAWEAGITAVKGRLDPALAQAYSDRYCIFSRRGPWLVVHAREPELAQMFHRGEALFSPLDGEFTARFRPPAG